MSETISDGGTAFPCDEYTKDGNHFRCHTGMTLRDYFAGQALANAAIANSNLDETATALVCYAQSQAMLKERERINDQR
jgi:hypothetical protein